MHFGFPKHPKDPPPLVKKPSIFGLKPKNYHGHERKWLKHLPLPSNWENGELKALAIKNGSSSTFTPTPNSPNGKVTMVKKIYYHLLFIVILKLFVISLQFDYF